MFALGDNAVNYGSAGCPNSLGCRVFLSLAHDTGDRSFSSYRISFCSSVTVQVSRLKLVAPNRVLYTVLVEADVSVANNVGLNARQLHLIQVEKGADCIFACFIL